MPHKRADLITTQAPKLGSANRKLHDSNDGLRSTLENSLSKYNKSLHVHNTSPGNTISQSSPKFSGRLSPFYDRSSHSSYMDEDCDMLAMCDPMCRVPEIHDEVAYSSDGNSSALDWKPPTPISRRDSSASVSMRKCISAISPQADNRDSNSKYPHSEKAYKVVLAGDAAVGKSSFLLRLCKNEFHGNTSATLGVDFQMKTLVVDGEPIVLQLWDTAGQERFRSIAKSYFRRADGVLLLYDVTYEKSLLNIQEWVDMIEDVSQGEIPIMLVGNKADLREQAIEEGIKCIPTSYGERLAMPYRGSYHTTHGESKKNVLGFCISGPYRCFSIKVPRVAVNPRSRAGCTKGVDFQMKTLVVDGEPIVLQLWDTAGQERARAVYLFYNKVLRVFVKNSVCFRFRSIAKSYFRRADGVLLLYDVTYEKSLLNIQEWVDMIEDVSQGEIPIMLVGNKADLREQAIEEGIKCIPTSYGERLAMILLQAARSDTSRSAPSIQAFLLYPVTLKVNHNSSVQLFQSPDEARAFLDSPGIPGPSQNWSLSADVPDKMYSNEMRRKERDISVSADLCAVIRLSRFRFGDVALLFGGLFYALMYFVVFLFFFGLAALDSNLS
ncbi:UNVERIFIED_CONTAM: hypothetical protein FKN15_000828 [Acipenser sinensis]